MGLWARLGVTAVVSMGLGAALWAVLNAAGVDVAIASGAAAGLATVVVTLGAVWVSRARENRASAAGGSVLVSRSSAGQVVGDAHGPVFGPGTDFTGATVTFHSPPVSDEPGQGSATEARLGQVELQRPVGLPSVQIVSEWNPFDLGIWPVLATPGHAQAQELPALPPYVARDHDADIDDHLAHDASCMIVVTGTSCTGKSRSLYEALLRNKRMRDWQLLCPVDSEQLLGMLVGNHLSPRTVLWLTDLDQYLLRPSGERIAAALRNLLRQPSITPVAVVSTLWPQYWTSSPGSPEEGFPLHILRPGSF